MNIPYGRQNISQSDIDSVYEVLQSDWLTQGPSITRFEEQLQSNFDVRFATVVSSATAALHIACLSLGLKEGDYLWTSANTFVASANCGLYCGALVDFVDIELDNYNICIDALEDKLIKAEKE
ncbi:MAG: UDP-4-amino-4,6-dideoxy-N-acetyl-beta-L-altrosamine transaminase, partial [Legionellales bacterium]|nr:UDP-4-amino-4,6-dideoxy-N-acetyl-beta-L-altrosamine transaminase [Legionellales bacterium]